MSVSSLTSDTFSSEIASWVTLVDFWAEWCGPCQEMLPVLENFSQEMDGKLQVAKVNVDDSPDIAQQFRVMSIPTMIVFQDGQAKESLVGIQSADKLKEMVEKYL